MTGVLLDTHIFLWALLRPDRITPATWTVLEDPARPLFLSMASAWEMAIKTSIGKLELPGGVHGFVAKGLHATHTTLLDVRLEHLAQLTKLPLHHRDPFDRLLIAQARSERFALLSFDRAFAAYDFDRP